MTFLHLGGGQALAPAAGSLLWKIGADSKDISCVRFVCGFFLLNMRWHAARAAKLSGLGRAQATTPRRIAACLTLYTIMLEVLPYKKSLACVWKSAWVDLSVIKIERPLISTAATPLKVSGTSNRTTMYRFAAWLLAGSHV